MEIFKEVITLQIPLWLGLILWYLGYVIGIQVEKNYKR